MATVTSDDGVSSMVVTGHPQHTGLAAALAAFQAELPKIRKGETAKVTGESKSGAKVSYSYGYAGLDTVVESALPVAGRHGLSITSKTTFTEKGEFMLEVTLLHASGERETSQWMLPDPRRGFGPQDIGSSTTYGRRYLTMGLLGIFPTGEDDDGATAQQAARESWENAKATKPAQQQAADAPAAPKTSWTDAEVYDILAKMSQASLQKAVNAYDWMAGKSLHNRDVGALAGTNGTHFGTATDLLARRLADEAMLPESTPASIFDMRTVATDRALLKVQVSETETLDQVLHDARELAEHAAAEPSPGSAGADGQ